MRQTMPDLELCNQIIASLHNEMPLHPEKQIQYLHDQAARFSKHPCFFSVADEIAHILSASPDASALSRFCTDVRDPSPFLSPLIADLDDALKTRNTNAAGAMLPPLILLSGQPWPSADGIRYCSFRDLIEYLYYEMICRPKQEIIAVPPHQTEIIRLHGEYLAMTGDHRAAIPILITGGEQNPVHAGILCSIAESHMNCGDLKDAIPYLKRSFGCAWKPDELAHAYRNQGFYLSRTGDDEGAICCYLMAMTWDDTAQGREELQFITGNTSSKTDSGYYQINGKDILSMRGIPTGPDPDMIDLLIQTADRYQEEQNLIKAREYLIRAHQLLMSDVIEGRIREIELFFEDMVDF